MDVNRGSPMRQCAAIMIRVVAFVSLLAAPLAPTAAAANLEIPQKYLDQEARTRAALSPAEQARVDIHVARLTTKMSLQDVRMMTGDDPTGSLFVVMMEYLKMLQKEAREDRKTARADRELSLTAKTGKIDQEKAKIEAQKREAEARFENAMAGANLEMVVGMVSGVATVGGAGLEKSAATGKGSVKAPTAVSGGVVKTGTVLLAPVATKTPTRTPAPKK